MQVIRVIRDLGPGPRVGLYRYKSPIGALRRAEIRNEVLGDL